MEVEELCEIKRLAEIDMQHAIHKIMNRFTQCTAIPICMITVDIRSIETTTMSSEKPTYQYVLEDVTIIMDL